MATTNAAVLAGLMGLSSAAFAAAAAPLPENTSLTAQPAPAACTVRLNRYDDGAPIDERYINTPSAKSTEYKGFPGIPFVHSGITYDQPTSLNGTEPTHFEGSFQAEAGLHNWYMPDNTYHTSDSKWAKGETIASGLFDVDGVVYDSTYTNWTHSVEVEIENPDTCITIRNELENARANPAQFNAMGNNSNDFAAQIWQHTGFPTDFDALKQADGVKNIDRETRLEQDHASGQLKSDYSTLPPAWKP